MNRNLVRLAIGGALAIGCLAFAGCTPKAPSAPLIVGLNPWPGFEFARLARAKGFFRDEKVNIKLAEFPSMADMRVAYERGRLDGMFSTVIEVLRVASRGHRKPVISLVVDYSNGGDAIVAKPQIASMFELHGKKVGLELASLNIFVLARALERAGMDFNAVKKLNIPQTELYAAMSRGEIDAAVTYPPGLNRIESELKTHRLFSSSEVPGEVLDVLSFEAKILMERSTDVRAVMRAFDRAQQYAKTHSEEARRIMAAEEGVPLEEFNQSLDTGLKIVEANQQSTFFSPNGSLKRVIDTASRVLVATKQMSTAVPAENVMPAHFPL